MGIIPPTKTSGKLVSIPHYQRVWLDKHSTINFSGLVQEMMIEIIKVHDPKYYKQVQPYLDITLTRKKEIIDEIVNTTPVIFKS